MKDSCKWINIFLGLSIPVNRRMYAGKDPSQLSQLGPSCTAYHNHLSFFSSSIFLYLPKQSHEMPNWTAIFNSMREIAQKCQKIFPWGLNYNIFECLNFPLRESRNLILCGCSSKSLAIRKSWRLPPHFHQTLYLLTQAFKLLHI